MAKNEITKKMAAEYARASKKRKGEILDLLCESTDWSRDNARRRLRQARRPQRARKKKGTRPLKFSPSARLLLVNTCFLSGQSGGAYLFYQIQEGLLERLVQHQELYDGRYNKGAPVSPDLPALAELKAMSPATIDRYLAAARRERQPLAKSTTKPAVYALRNEIPLASLIPGIKSQDGSLLIQSHIVGKA